MVYLIIIALSCLIIYLPNALINPANIDNPWLYYLIALAIFVVGEVILDALVAIIGRKLPEKCVNPRKGFILTRDWEMKLFLFLRIQKWKNFMPDLGAFTKFPKGNLLDPYNNEYIKRYIVEASYGVWIHYVSVPASLLILLLGFIEPSNVTLLTVGLPVVFVNMILILLPALTLKFNLPRLIRIADMNDKFLEKHKNDKKETD